MRNQVDAKPQARLPRGMVKINGAPCAGWVDWEVDNNTFYSADTFKTRFAFSILPSDRGPDWWASAEKIEVEILAGFPADPNAFTAADLESLFLGNVDDLDTDWGARAITISGRDLTALLIDTKTSEKYPNQTASAIATKLAAKHGLTPVVTATKTKVGRYYQIDKVRLQDEQTEWDLLTWLAREEQFVVYVKGKELHFEPRPEPSKDPYVIKYVPPERVGEIAYANAGRIQVSRNLTLAKDIKVTVRSWNAKQKRAFSKVAKATRAKNAVTAGRGKSATPVQEYFYTIANLTPDQAQQRANQLLAELTKHEVKLSVDMPADNILGVADVIKLDGTGTAADQVFFPDSIVRSMAREGGYQMRVEAKNHSPESQPSL